jgi:RNA polymerase-binding transcription factor DksA
MKERMQSLITRRLRHRRSELRRRLAALDTDMRRDEAGPLSPDWAEQSSERANDAVLASIRQTCEAELRQVESALQRLAEGTYGVCCVCGEPIELGRLYSVPHADRCTECASARGSASAPPGPRGGSRS